MIKIISHNDIISSAAENAILTYFCEKFIYFASSYDLINLRLNSPLLSKELQYKKNFFIPSDFENDTDEINNIIRDTDIIFFDSFLFLTNKETYIINTALSLNKTVCFINKIFPDETGKHIIDNILSSVKNEYTRNIEYINLPLTANTNKTNLDMIKQKFPLLNQNNINENFDDNTVKIFTSFPNLDFEFRFIVKSISEKLKKEYDGDTDKIVSTLKNDFCIVLPNEFNKYKNKFKKFFKEEGLFLLNQELLKTDTFSDIDISFLNKIYFKKRDFLKSAVLNKKGQPLNFTEKLELFNKCYFSIDIIENHKDLISLPVSKYILLFCDIIFNGISVSNFKELLFLNQKYAPSDEEWNVYISDFKFVKLYFENSSDINEWFSTAVRLINLRLEMTEDKIYEYHPLYCIKFESLSFFQKTLWDLSNVVYKFEKFKDDFNLISSLLINQNNIPFNLAGSNENFNSIGNTLLKTSEDIKSVANNLEKNSFSGIFEHITKNLDLEINISNPLTINIVSPTNIKPFKYSYMTMSERTKYHKPLIDKFQLTEEFDDISYSLPILPSASNERILNERYLLKNILDFTTEEITFTSSAKNFSGQDLESVYLNDISDIIQKPPENFSIARNNKSFDLLSTDKTKSFKFEKKDVYTVRELGVFLLCPKLYYLNEEDDEKSPYITEFTLRYYAEALIFCDTINHFMEYNLDYKRKYPKYNGKYKDILLNFFKESFELNQRFFIFFSDSELKKIYTNIENRLLLFIDNAVKSVKSKKFSVINYKDKIYNYQGLNIKVESDCRIYEPDLKKWRMRSNDEYLDFLVRSASYTAGIKPVYKYDFLKNILDGNDVNQDRLAAALGIISKISIQYDNVKYSLDGFYRAKKITEELLNYDFADAKAKQSGYCRYCSKFDICLGK